MKTPLISKTHDQQELSDFRFFLQRELMNRCARNPLYSLRSFAKSLQLHPSTLSQILRGIRPITPSNMQKIGLTLGLSPTELDRFATALHSTHGIQQKKTSESKSFEEQQLRELSGELFLVMSDWYHDAILEFTRLPSFQSNSRWVAKKLGITVSEVNMAVERLQRLEFLKIDESGQWINQLNNNTAGTNDFMVNSDIISAAFRKLQKQILELSIASLEGVPKSMRSHSSMMVGFNSEDLPAIRTKIKAFRRSILAFCERKESHPQSVYQLAVSFFPITKK